MRFAIFNYYSIKGSKKLHEEMIVKIMKAPINLYYDCTPIGRILNLFTKDFNDTETGISGLNLGLLSIFYDILQIIAIAVIALPYISIIFPIVSYIMYKII